MTRALEFTLTVNKCLGCSFCPQTELNDAYTGVSKMGLHDFSTILGKLPKDTICHFGGYSESLLNSECGHMMKHASQSGYKVHWYTTLVGFTDAQARPIRTANIEVIRIHVPDLIAFRYPAGKWLDYFQKFVATGRLFTMMAMGRDIDQRILDKASETDHVVELPTMLSRAGNLWEQPKKTGRIICAMDRWTSNVVVPNGDVYLCCMDFGLSTKLGNLLTEDYQAIEGRALALRDAAHSPEICLSCEWSQQV